MAFEIEIDTRFDRSGFFDSAEARAALEAAAGLWEAVIRDDFATVPAGVSFSLRNPSDDTLFERVTLDRSIDDLRLFVGAQPLDGATLARAGPVGFDVAGDVFQARIASAFRDLGPATDFEPFAGVLTIDSAVSWSFGPGPPAPGLQDLVTVAAHEIGHVLGIATSGAYARWREGGAFTGPNARAANDGAPVPLTGDGHVVDGFLGDTVLMDPTLAPGARKAPGPLDHALLADIGFEIDGFAAQGAPLPLVTDAGERLRGTELADRLDALGGPDLVFGGGGADTLVGTPGDTLTGGAGADIFRPAPEAGRVTITDFEPGTDTILLDPAFGIHDPAELLLGAGQATAVALRPGLGLTLSVSLEDSAANDLTASDFEIDSLQAVRGTAGPDTLSGSTGDDRVEGFAGDDVLLASPGRDHLLGGAGGDSALYAAPRAALSPDLAPDGTITLAKPGGGVDRLTGIERIGFEGGAFLYDLDPDEAGLAYRLFEAALDRTPAEDGLRFWVQQIEAGTPPRDLARAFAGSAEFTGRVGGAATDAAFVTALFEGVLDRAPEQAGLDHWTGRLAAGAQDRPGLLLAFAESAEHVTRTAENIENGFFVLTEADALII